MTPLLAASGVSWSSHGRVLLGPVDLAIERGETFVLVGPNGAGKTTLLRLLAGIVAPTSGRVLLDGLDIAQRSRREVARRIAYVPQSREESVPLTVRDLVLTGRFPHLPRLAWAPRPQDWHAVDRALELVEVQSLGDRPVDELSGGERQAVYIAAALAQEAEILVLDEPTTHLDPRHQRDIAALVARLGGASGSTIVLATHDVAFALRVADRVAGLRQGRVLLLGGPADVLAPTALETLFDAPFRTVDAGTPRATLVLDFEPPEG